MPGPPRTLFEKIWSARVVEDLGDGRALIHTDRHVMQEGTCGGGFGAARAHGRTWRARACGAGLDRVFREAGFEWRESACSMCVATNGDTLAPGQRSISTSNRIFDGRQGPGSRTHLASTAMVAAAALAGHITDLRKLARAC